MQPQFGQRAETTAPGHSRVSTTSWGRLTAMVTCLGGLAGLGLIFAGAEPPSKREITLSVQPVALSATAPERDRVGALTFRGGLALRSPDPGFGGLSGLLVDPVDGGFRMLAVTDQGDRFSARLVLKGGRLAGVESPSLEPLLDLRGRPVRGKSLADAESMTRGPNGGVLVGFERQHRIWGFGPGLTGPAVLVDTPAALQKAPMNNGIEALARWPDGRLLAITQGLRSRRGNLAAFLFENGSWKDADWKPSAPYLEPSDAAVLPNGDLVVLERFWSLLPSSLRSTRLTRVGETAITAGTVLQGEVLAEIKPPLTIENFEGLAIFTDETGKTRLLIVSDDNFSRLQRTLLFLFEWSGPAPGPPPHP